MSELALGQIKGLPINNNIVTVPSGHTLYAPGHVIQVVSAKYSTMLTTSSTTAVDTGLTATITPKFASSKILVITDQPGFIRFSGATTCQYWSQLVRGTTVVQSHYTQTNVGEYTTWNASLSYLDSPATTSATTYKTQIYNNTGQSMFLQWAPSDSHITLMEIAA